MRDEGRTVLNKIQITLRGQRGEILDYRIVDSFAGGQVNEALKDIAMNCVFFHLGDIITIEEIIIGQPWRDTDDVPDFKGRNSND